MARMTTLLTLLAIYTIAAQAGEKDKALKLGEGVRGPWWMSATSLTTTGGLSLDDMPWWEEAQALAVDEALPLDNGRMLVRREVVEDRGGRTRDCIVWVIDDDEDGSLAEGGDVDSDCYVVDYGRDGTVDRMVDYIDDDGDGDPDEMDIRYFVDGELRYCWFGVDTDDDSAMWSLRGYEYGGPSFFESDPYGDSMIYMNKLDTAEGDWSPISECPFAFYDTDEDGQSEVTIRCSAVPLTYDVDADPDYANDYAHFAAPWNPALSRMGIVNVRYSFDIDRGSTDALPLHYEVGLNLVGAQPYDYPGMTHFNAKRRPPQTTIVTPWEDLREISDTYPARETGLSWSEHADDTIAIGHDHYEADDWRWEGVFWTWERHFMENTGGPNQKWNVRREYRDTPSDTRTLYYSPTDRRIHLKGAKEGWLQVGHFAGLGALGEVRMFDTDEDGYLDRWEYDFGDWHRVASVADTDVEELAWSIEAITEAFTERILPEAVEANARFIEAMASVREYTPDPKLAEAAAGEPGNHQRYAQDILRELQYADFYTHWSGAINDALAAQPMDDLRHLDETERAAGVNSQTAWELRRVLTRIDTLYGQGKLLEAAKVLEESRAQFMRLNL